MTAQRFDPAALTGRVSGPGWRRFRAEAIAGEHGEDLAERRWWRRAVFGPLLLMTAAATVALPVIILSTAGDDPVAIVGAILLALACVVGTGAVLGSRTEYWGPRARDRYRLRTFARSNGLEYTSKRGGGRLAADIFSYGQNRRHLDHVDVPGPQAYVVSNYECDPWPDDPDTGTDQWGYVVFTLRETYPHTMLTRRRWSLAAPRALSDVDPAEGPSGMRVLSTKPDHPLLRRLLESGVVGQAVLGRKRLSIEIIGNELFLLAQGFLPLRSPGLWRQLETIAQTLAPFLAHEERADTGNELAVREG